MKKAGIITLFGEYNFGNRLQNYAVQQVLKAKGLDVETIKFIMTTYKEPEINNEKDKNRLLKFKEFNKRIKFADEILYMDLDAPIGYADNYDYIVFGSDQIWNYTFSKSFTDKNLGSFVPKNKKFSFSASFGVEQLPEKGSNLFFTCQKYLNDIKAISVREDAGKNIAEQLTGRNDVEVLLDPTMILDTKEWEKIAKKPEKLKTNKFIVKSFLGEASKEIISELYRVAEQNNCEIVDISDPKSDYYDVGPEEFLYLERNAFLNITDSFHACVFSILFSTPFIAIKRQDKYTSMYSRIETLLDKFEMKDRIFNGTITEEYYKQDFSKVQSILQKERAKADTFLEKALK